MFNFDSFQNSQKVSKSNDKNFHLQLNVNDFGSMITCSTQSFFIFATAICFLTDELSTDICVDTWSIKWNMEQGISVVNVHQKSNIMRLALDNCCAKKIYMKYLTFDVDCVLKHDFFLPFHRLFPTGNGHQFLWHRQHTASSRHDEILERKAYYLEKAGEINVCLSICTCVSVNSIFICSNQHKTCFDLATSFNRYCP